MKGGGLERAEYRGSQPVFKRRRLLEVLRPWREERRNEEELSLRLTAALEPATKTVTSPLEISDAAVTALSVAGLMTSPSHSPSTRVEAKRCELTVRQAEAVLDAILESIIAVAWGVVDENISQQNGRTNDGGRIAGAGGHRAVLKGKERNTMQCNVA